MEDFKNILYPVALTDISPKVAPYVVTLAKQLGAQVHLLHVLRPFDWFVDTYVSDPPKPDFKRIASDFEDQILLQAQQKLEQFKQKHLKNISIANAIVITGTNYKQILEYTKSEGIDLIITDHHHPPEEYSQTHTVYWPKKTDLLDHLYLL